RASDLPGYVYVILLTARDSNEDIVAGLQAGADDYLVKPFNPHELLARIAVGERILALEDRLTQARDQLEHLAMYDALTDLLNRRALYRRAQADIERARRAGKPLSVIFLDVDRFKQINDRHGHQVGDLVLQHVARVLRTHSRSYDSVGRWAGDEFMIVLPEIGEQWASDIASRILDAVARSPVILPDGQHLPLSISIGISTLSAFDDPDTALDRLVRQADRAMYRAKEAGGGQVAVAEREESDVEV
ncbi:MAG: diguanylate cyclase, partial [Anaerolineae bacterium]